jgi:poly(rC)-binding protein 3/4
MELLSIFFSEKNKCIGSMDHPEDNYEEKGTYEEQENYEGQENFQEEEGSPGENGEEHVEEQVEGEIEQDNDIQTGNGENNGEDAEQIELDDDDSQEKVEEEKRWPGWPGENAFRMLVPVNKVGAVIGHKGDIIKKMSEETKARIRVLNSPPGVQERVVCILI